MESFCKIWITFTQKQLLQEISSSITCFGRSQFVLLFHNVLLSIKAGYYQKKKYQYTSWYQAFDTILYHDDLILLVFLYLSLNIEVLC